MNRQSENVSNLVVALFADFHVFVFKSYQCFSWRTFCYPNNSRLLFYNSCLKGFSRPYLPIALLSVVHTTNKVSGGVF